MISVDQAEKLIFEFKLNLETEQVPLTSAGRRMLREDIQADRDFPPFNRVTMDGIAIDYQGWDAGHRKFHITGVQAAGDPAKALEANHQCLEVMTGAVLPMGTDTVIPYEDIEIIEENSRYAEIQVTPNQGQNIHRQGQDRTSGEVIVQSGSVLGSPEIGVAATVGKSQLLVSQLPKIAIISTGDEIVPIDQQPLPHQIRSSNAHTMAHALLRWGVKPDFFHLSDDLEGTTNRLKELLTSYHILILSGGVSKGKFDHVPEALGLLNVNQSFHRIKQRPGKPFWSGWHASGCLIFAFPGNPVSSFMCFNRYLRPWMDREMGIVTPTLKAVLQEDVTFIPDLTYFAQVKIGCNGPTLVAWPVEGHGSGDLANLVDADGFMELPAGRDLYGAGESYPLYLYRDL